MREVPQFKDVVEVGAGPIGGGGAGGPLGPGLKFKGCLIFLAQISVVKLSSATLN
jgi:hypothetical protein